MVSGCWGRKWKWKWNVSKEVWNCGDHRHRPQANSQPQVTARCRSDGAGMVNCQLPICLPPTVCTPLPPAQPPCRPWREAALELAGWQRVGASPERRSPACNPSSLQCPTPSCQGMIRPVPAVRLSQTVGPGHQQRPRETAIRSGFQHFPLHSSSRSRINACCLQHHCCCNTVTRRYGVTIPSRHIRREKQPVTITLLLWLLLSCWFHPSQVIVLNADDENKRARIQAGKFTGAGVGESFVVGC